MTQALARASFACLAVALLTLTGRAVALRRAEDGPWWSAARWSAVADALGLAGGVLLAGAAVLTGLAAIS